jgi:hypothetical protein
MAAAAMKNKLSLQNTLRILLILMVLFSTASYVSAQAGRQINISAPDTENFPRMTLYFDVMERDGGKITDLTADQLTLREDGVERDLIDFQALRPGIQVVAAINISPPFAIQDVSGRSRFEYIREGLLNWVRQPLASAPDDLSLLTNDGIELTHLAENDVFIDALQDYKPDLRETEANLTVLARAIEIASDPVSQLGMKQIVLFFSSQPPPESAEALESLLDQASESQVQVYTILVSSPAFFASTGASRLQILSTETGGAFLPFSGEEPLVDIGQLLAPLRTTHFVAYDSQIVTSGDHNLELSVITSLGESQGMSEFFLDVQPPNPFFVSPPREVIRSVPDNGDQNTEILIYQPESISLNVLVEFPDNHPRDLEELIFRVDGELVDRRVSPPFDKFVWDLSGYQSSATHRLTIEAIDILGLSRLSLQTPIEVKVEIPPPDLGTIVSNNALALGGLAVILLIGIFLFVLISGGRIQPSDPIGRRSLINKAASRSGVRKSLPSRKDPQYVGDDALMKDFIPYRLIPINDISQQLFPEPIRIIQPEIFLGNDPGANQVHIDHHSIVRKHAQISLGRGNKHQIKDFGSPVGTWINYQQIPVSKFQLLKDGDIINIGEAGFRFQIITTISPESSTQEKSK